MYQYKPSVYQSIQQGKEVKNIRKGLKKGFKKGPTKKLTVQQQQAFWLPNSYLPRKRAAE
jgi:hypothetical protein